MDYSAANHQLWNVVIQIAYIAIAILLADLLRRKVKIIRKLMM